MTRVLPLKSSRLLPETLEWTGASLSTVTWGPKHRWPTTQPKNMSLTSWGSWSWTTCAWLQPASRRPLLTCCWRYAGPPGPELMSQFALGLPFINPSCIYHMMFYRLSLVGFSRALHQNPAEGVPVQHPGQRHGASSGCRRPSRSELSLKHARPSTPAQQIHVYIHFALTHWFMITHFWFFDFTSTQNLLSSFY